MTSIMIPIATGEANAGRDEDGNVVTTYGKPSAMANILAFLRTLSILVLIFGVVVSGYSIFAMEASFGETPPVPNFVHYLIHLLIHNPAQMAKKATSLVLVFGREEKES